MHLHTPCTPLTSATSPSNTYDYRRLPELSSDETERTKQLKALIKWDQRFTEDDQGHIIPKRPLGEAYLILPLKRSEMMLLLQKAYQLLREKRSYARYFYLDNSKKRDLFFLAKKSTPQQPRLQWYRWTMKPALKGKGSFGDVYSVLKMSTGRVYVVKRMHPTVQVHEAEYEYLNSRFIQKTLHQRFEELSSQYGPDVFIPYQKRGGGKGVECISFIKITAVCDRMLFMPAGLPLESTGDEQVNYKNCLEYVQAHEILNKCGGIQLDAKIQNAIRAIPKGNDTLRKVQLIDLGLLLPSEKGHLFNYFRYNKSAKYFLVGTFHHPQLRSAEGRLLERICKAGNVNEAEEHINNAVALIEKHMCLMKLIVFVKLVHNYRFKADIGTLCYHLFLIKRTKVDCILSDDFFALQREKPVSTRINELATKLATPSHLQTLPLVTILLSMAVDPDNITTYYQQAIDYINDKITKKE